MRPEDVLRSPLAEESDVDGDRATEERDGRWLIEVCLAEHEALRSEMRLHERIKEQLALTSLGFAGAVFVFALTTPDTWHGAIRPIHALFSVPWLGFVFFVLWWRQTAATARIGRYVIRNLIPTVSGAIQANQRSPHLPACPLLGWEIYLRSEERTSPTVVVARISILFTCFLAPGVVSAVLLAFLYGDGIFDGASLALYVLNCACMLVATASVLAHGCWLMVKRLAMNTE